jgi:hypothetical protein
VRIGFQKWPQTAQYFFDGLVKFGLIRVTLLEASEEGFD